MWRGLAGDRPPFGDGVTVVVEPHSQLCPDGFVGVVSIGDGVLATVPTPELAAPVEAVLNSVPIHEATMVKSFEAVFDVGGLLGPARLAYLDAAAFRPVAPRHGWRVEPVEPDSARLTAFLAGCPSDEAGESALADATSTVALVLDGDDTVIAASGWHAWPRRTAHVGVLTAPHARSRGAGRAAASAAVTEALAAGLLPQWRARIPASRRVATALGFTEVGAQLSLQVTPRTP
jgi:GNAT superfamily N-acetyltransferase